MAHMFPPTAARTATRPMCDSPPRHRRGPKPRPAASVLTAVLRGVLLHSSAERPETKKPRRIRIAVQ